MKLQRITLVLFTLVFFTAHASAQWFSDPSGILDEGAFRADLSFSLNETDYELKDAGLRLDIPVERQILGVTLAYGISDAVDVFLAAGLILDAEPQIRDDDLRWRDSGDGYLLSAGARGVLYRQDQFSLMGYGYVQHIDEDYGRLRDEYDFFIETTRLEADRTELALGVLGRYDVTEEFHVYAGLEVILVDDGDLNVKFTEENLVTEDVFRERVTFDMDRDDILTARAGAAYQAGNALLRAEYAFLGEETLTVGVGINF